MHRPLLCLFAFCCLSRTVLSQRLGSYVTLKNLGCWRDGATRIIPSLEGRSDILDGFYKTRGDAVQKCARAALKRGYRVFAIQDGGWCGSSAVAIEKYSKLGKAENCGRDGKGGFRANHVYEIAGTVINRSAGTGSRPSIVQPSYVFERGHQRGRGTIAEKKDEGAHEFILSDFGCWALPSSGYRSMEGLLDELDGYYKRRSRAVTKCAKGLGELGFEIFAMHDGGKCLAVDNMDEIVGAMPRRKICSHTGKGTSSSIQVYEIRYSKTRFSPPPLRTTSTTTTTTTTTPPTTPTTKFMPWWPPRVVTPIYVDLARTTAWTPARRPHWTPTREPVWTPRQPITTRQTWTPRRPSPTRRITSSPRSDTEYLHLTNLGCWMFAWNDSLPTLEGSSPSLDGHYSQRLDAVKKCAKVASGFGYEIFAVQDGGRCAASGNARQRFARLGRSTFCREDGRGGSWVNQVYEVNVIWDVTISGLGCFAEGQTNTISSLEGSSDLLDGEYYRRKDGIRKCARLAARRGFQVFALQDDGKCLGDEKAQRSYSNSGPSTACPKHGRGGFGANEVYQIVSKRKIKLRNLGCWEDRVVRAVSGMEQTDGDLMDNYKIRKDAIGKCARVAHRNGFKVFVIQDGGWCGGSTTAETTYSKYGRSNGCRSDGEGGVEANQVFEIVKE